MPIVADGQLNFNGLQVDDVYTVIIPPQTPIIAGVPSDGIGLVGSATKGLKNTPVLIGDIATLIRTFGEIQTSQYDLVTEVIGAMKQGANNFYCVRVTDGLDVACRKAILTSGALLMARAGRKASTVAADNSGENTGTWANGSNAKIEIGVGTQNVATPNTGSIAISVPSSTNTITLTIGGTAVTGINGSTPTYTVGATDTIQTIVAALCARINADPNSKLIVQATISGATGNVVLITALTPGITTSQTIALVTAGTGAIMTVSGLSAGATGNLSGATGTAIFRVTISANNEFPEIFDNLADTLAIYNAVNQGIAGVRTQSNLFFFESTAPAAGIFPRVQSTANAADTSNGGTSGLDGNAGVNGNVLLGNDGFTRTGMYALRNYPISQFGLAGVTDQTSWGLQVSFARDENAVAVLGFAAGETSQGAVIKKQAVGVADYHAVMVKDWLYLNDTKNNLIRLVSPIGVALGGMGALSPERSPSNKPIFGYLGTERTGYFNANGAFVAGIPYSMAEIGLLEANGILFATNPAVGGPYLAFRHGQNTSSNPTTNGINYSKMTIFLAESLQAAMGFAVGEPHTEFLRQRVRTSIQQFLGTLANPGAGAQPMIGDVSGGPAFGIICDNSNNPKNMVSQGYFRVDVQVVYLSIVRFFILSLEGGQSVTVRVSATPLPVAA